MGVPGAGELRREKAPDRRVVTPHRVAERWFLRKRGKSINPRIGEPGTWRGHFWVRIAGGQRPIVDGQFRDLRVRGLPPNDRRPIPNAHLVAPLEPHRLALQFLS